MSNDKVTVCQVLNAWEPITPYPCQAVAIFFPESGDERVCNYFFTKQFTRSRWLCVVKNIVCAEKFNSWGKG